MQEIQKKEEEKTILDRMNKNEQYFLEMLNTISSRVYFREYFEPPKVHKYMKKKERKENQKKRNEMVKQNKMQHYDPFQAYSIKEMQLLVDKQDNEKASLSRKRKHRLGEKRLMKDLLPKTKQLKRKLSAIKRQKEQNKKKNKQKMLEIAKRGRERDRKIKRNKNKGIVSKQTDNVRFSMIKFGGKRKQDIKRASLKTELKRAEKIQQEIKKTENGKMDIELKSQLMKNALNKVKGVKVKDDVKKIKKTMKRVKKRKEKSKQKWKERKSQQRKELKRKMKQREINLKKKKVRGKK
ncbi:surfeit locus protein [Anaeramoeba flamelloides]|uniref:Surfeit locus protein n=1 Tax=Anaeramoeba flamelloides TaxID=1746091 RepID=A0AAV8A3S9_9EUKA|nr:surfeit locus protein [Anaeramoeba flamelloides]